MMNAHLVTLARDLKYSGFGRWKEIAKLLDVNVHVLRYHAITKRNPRALASHRRASRISGLAWRARRRTAS